MTAVASGKSAGLIGMPDLAGVMQGVGAVTGFFTVLISRILITAIFFVFIKFMTHTQSGFKPFLAVTGYASLPLIVGTALMLLVTAVFPTAFDGWARMGRISPESCGPDMVSAHLGLWICGGGVDPGTCGRSGNRNSAPRDGCLHRMGYVRRH